MDKLLKPERLNVDPNSSGAEGCWTHWFKTFHNFTTSLGIEGEDRLKLLVNYVGAAVYSYISECLSYDDAITTLSGLYVKPVNEIYARHCLATRHQQSGESIDQFYKALKSLSKDCNFTQVSAVTYKKEYIRDAFITGLSSSHIRQRLLERPSLNLEDALLQARSLESAFLQSETFSPSPRNINAVGLPLPVPSDLDSPSLFSQESPSPPSTSASLSKKCYYCGYSYHPRPKCPARNETCNNCQKRGHFSKVCRQKREGKTTAAATLAGMFPGPLSKAVVDISVNELRTDALVDTGSTESFISYEFALLNHLKLVPFSAQVSMAASTLNSTVKGKCIVTIKLKNYVYPEVSLCALPGLCANVILGHDILSRHHNVSFKFGGPQRTLYVNMLSTARVPPAHLFEHLSRNIRPIATKSRRLSKPDQDFVLNEIKRLQDSELIEESNSPWRAQVVVVSGPRKRLVVDYSRTINIFTELDAFPLPRIDDTIQRIAQYRIFSTIDLKQAYHQVPIPKEDRHYTAFEACGKLWQFKVISFGLTNGVAAFQRTISRLIGTEKLTDTFAYLDDVTVCGSTQEEHDANLSRFMNMAQKYNLTLNRDKCIFSAGSICILGHLIENGTIRPDPDRLEPLISMPPPRNTAALRRAVGMLAHYAQWVKGFSEKIRPLTHNTSFPLCKEAVEAFEKLKTEISHSATTPIMDELPFIVETDASNVTLGATLSQNGKPVAFFSKTLSGSEQRLSSVEKEAYSIVEALKRWRHYLIGRHFTLITDQRSVAFMFSLKTNSKIKNEKVLRWRLELSCYKFDIVYRPGAQNTVADALSRTCATMSNPTTLYTLHNSLCHPGVTRLFHWIRSKNLPYSLADIKRVTSTCSICSEIKPRFYRPDNHLIKATSPFERLNLDFKGPIPSNSRNRYILTVVDEFSRFPFAFPCRDLSSATVIKHLRQLFSTFGVPSFIHSDRGTAFISRELRSFLTAIGVASSFSTPYNPQGNGLVERYNGIIWKTVTLALRSSNVGIDQWETTLDEALHAVRSLLCTSTNATPHERFFKHPRRTGFGTALPSWLLSPGSVLLRSPVRTSKYSPLVEEVQLLEANPQYAHIRYPDGRESTVSLRHLAPCGENVIEEPSPNELDVSAPPPLGKPIDPSLRSPELQPPSSSFPPLSPHRPSPTATLSPQSPCLPPSAVTSPQDPSSQPNSLEPPRTRRRPGYLQDYVL